MKTLKEIQLEIAELMKSETDKEKSSARKQLKSLRLAEKYLEFNPTSESVNRQMDEVKRGLKICAEKYKKYKSDNDKIIITKAKYNKAYPDEKTFEAKLVSERKFLKLILG